MTTTEFIQTFQKFSKKQQAEIANKINKQVFAETYNNIDKELPDLDISEEEVIKAVKEIRHGNKKKA